MLLEGDSTLRQKVINRLNGDLIDEPIIKGEDPSSFGLLIVDEFSAKILSNYLTMTDILNRGIFTVESIYQTRQHFPNYQGIYFISPTDKSCKALAKDFEDKKNPTYKKIHIFFTHMAAEQHLQALINEGVINRTVTCSEFNLSFYTVCPNVFDLKLESELKIYKCCDFIREKLIRIIAQRLLTVCCNLKVRPYVQFQKSSKLCEDLATILEDYINALPFTKEREGILLLVDRKLDLATPVLHDYNYETMIHDFFDIKDGKFEINGKKYELKWNDELWNTYRSLHIAEVFDRLTKDLADFQKSDISKARDAAKLDSFEGMASALTGMNAYKKKTGEFSTQIDISQELNKKYKERSIYELIELEQDILTGDNGGRKVNTRDIFKTFTILKSKIQEQREDLLRLLMVLFISLSIAERDFKVLQGKLSDDEQKVFDNLKQFFGIEENSAGKAEFRAKNKTERKSSSSSKLSENMNYSTLRSAPQFEILIEKASKYSLDFDAFPLCKYSKDVLPKSEESKFGGKAFFSGSPDEIIEEEEKKNLIFFSIGGIGRNEIAAIEKLGRSNRINHKLTIGSTNVFNARQYIKAIQNLSEVKLEEVDRDCFEAYGIKDSILNVSVNSGSTDSFK